MNFVWSTTEPLICILPNGGHWNKFMVLEEFLMRCDKHSLRLTFPVGWETDFTSSPPWSRGFVSQLGAHSPAALLHDRMLDLGHDRHFARSVMNEQLKDLTLVPNWRRYLIIGGIFLNDQKIKLQKL